MPVRDHAALDVELVVLLLDFGDLLERRHQRRIRRRPGRRVIDLDLAKRFHTVIVSNVPRFDATNPDELRRFTLLVDVFYESRIKLILSAVAPLDELLAVSEDDVNSRYKAMVFEFSRTLSRLTEMQAKEYMTAARLPPR
jgi:predicted ATPase